LREGDADKIQRPPVDAGGQLVQRANRAELSIRMVPLFVRVVNERSTPVPSTKREVWGAIVTVLFVASAIIGILTGLPQLIRDNVHHVPSWIANPNFIWVASLLVVETIAVLLILAPWRKPHQTADDPEIIKNLGPQFLFESQLFHFIDRAIKELSAISEASRLQSAILHWVDSVAPTFIETWLGKKEKEKYARTIEEAKPRCRNEADTLRIAVTYLQSMMMKRIDEKVADMLRSRGLLNLSR
jgi:hypothetical protein